MFSYFVNLFLNVKSYRLDPTSKKLADVPVPAGVHSEVEVVIPEKYIIPSAVLTIGSPANNCVGKGLFTISEFLIFNLKSLVAIYFIF